MSAKPYQELGFDEIKLGDAVTFQRGFDITKNEQSAGDIPIVSSSGVSSFHNQWKTRGPGVVIGRKGTLGTVHYLKGNFWPHDTTLWVKDFKGNNRRFIYYFIRPLHLENFDTGSSNPTLNRNHIHKIKVVFPKPYLQKKIAAVLSTYDDLIENNTRRIALLEKMAEEIYREWFVRMRFPGHKKVKSVKGVPVDWDYDRASEFFSVVKGKSYGGDEVTENSSHMPFITLKSFNRGGGYREDGLKYYSGRFNDDQIVLTDDIVMAVTDMTQNREVVGQVAKVPNFGNRGAVISLDVIKIVPKKVTGAFLYSYLRFSGFSKCIKEFANGANVLHLKSDLVTHQKINIPTMPLQLAFSEAVKPIYNQIDLLSASNKSMTEMRNMLHPRLISGKLSIENLEIQYPPSMANEDSHEKMSF